MFSIQDRQSYILSKTVSDVYSHEIVDGFGHGCDTSFGMLRKGGRECPWPGLFTEIHEPVSPAGLKELL
jgi:hypothetical protein